MVSNENQEAKWRQVLQEGDEDDLDSDDDVDNFAVRSDVAQSSWISDILKNEPTDKLWVRREDPRVGGCYVAPAQMNKSFQKQRIFGTKVQYKYHEAEMNDLDTVRPLKLTPTDKIFAKREYKQWIEKYYTQTTMYFQFSRIIYEKNDGDRMYSVYQSNGHSFQVVQTPPIRVIED